MGPATLNNAPKPSGYPPSKPPGPRWIYTFGGVAGMALFTIFLADALSLILSMIGGSSNMSPSGVVAHNWLLLLLQVNLPHSGVTSRVLSTLSLLDLAIMLVFAFLSVSLLPLHIRISRFWSIIAALLPILGIPVFVLTGTAGRSALLISALVFSAIMFRGHDFGAREAWMGLTASTLLFFFGDIATALFSSSAIIAWVLAVGYITWVTWLFLLSIRLFVIARAYRSAVLAN
jgi:hypothetical protein